MTPSRAFLVIIALSSVSRVVFGGVIQFGRKDEDSVLAVEKMLFNSSAATQSHDTAKDYNIHFKLADTAEPSIVSCVELLLNGSRVWHELGDIHYDRKDQAMQLTLNVSTGRNFTLHLRVFTSLSAHPKLLTMPALDGEVADRWFMARFVQPQMQSATLVRTATPSRPKMFEAPKGPRDWGGAANVEAVTEAPKRDSGGGSFTTIGQRQRGDRLLDFRSRRVENLARFPSRELEFVGGAEQAFSCVHFAFNSPTAMAFVNSGFVAANNFTAIVYDLGAEHFVANVSVYGYETMAERPAYYQPMLNDLK